MILPYLELPLAIGYAGQEDKIVVGKFQPSRITAYHEGFNSDIGMFIYQDGQPFQIALSLAQYESKINAYWDILSKQQAKQAANQTIKQRLKIN